MGERRGEKSGDEVGHEMHKVTHEDGAETMHCIRTTHAEQNAIVQSARIGVALDGSTIYCSMTPCYVCAKMVINAGIVRVVCKNDYHASKRSKEIFKEAGVEYTLLSNETVRYDKM